MTASNSAPEEREALYAQITATPDVHYAIGIVDVQTIDRINILQATFLAMRRAVENLSVKPDYLLIDGNQLPHFDIPTESLIQGDAPLGLDRRGLHSRQSDSRSDHGRTRREVASLWLSAAQGVCDRPASAALQKWGPCVLHRRSFDPIKSMLDLLPFKSISFNLIHIRVEWTKRSCYAQQHDWLRKSAGWRAFGRLTVEIQSVNRKYLEVFVSLPKELGRL